MDTGCRLRLEWVPEAYKTEDVSDNHPQKSIDGQQPLAGKGLYGHSAKKYPDKLCYSKKIVSRLCKRVQGIGPNK